MSRHEDMRRWAMVICDCDPAKPMETYAGFCVMRIADNQSWTNEVARFYDGDPYADFDTALAYAESIAVTVLQAAEIEDFWKRVGRATVKRNG